MIMKCANCYDSVATMLAEKLKVIETMSDEIQTLRAKVASVEVLVEALRTVMNEAEEIVLHDTNFVAVPFEIFDKMEDEYEALTTYDKLSEVKHDTK